MARIPKQKPEPLRIAEKGIGDFRVNIADTMKRAAEEARRTIDTDRMVITTRDDILVVNAPIAKPPGKASIFEYPMFVYLGLSGSQCANTIPSGFYTIRVVTNPKLRVPEAHYIDLKGRTVLVNPVTLETRKPARRDATRVRCR